MGLHIQGSGRAISSQLQRCCEDFKSNGSFRAQAKHYGNVVHMPVFKQCSTNTKVIDVFPLPELHLLTSPFNTLMAGLKTVWPDCEAWVRHCHINLEAQHGGTFTGTSCRTLLSNIDLLAAMGPVTCLPYITALHSFDAVVSTCYMLHAALHPGFCEAIVRFRTAFLDLGIRITPKIYAVFLHVADFCGSRQRGLGICMEQAVEPAHHDFLTVWRHFEVRNSRHPAFGRQLLRAMQTYNSRHL